MWKLKYFLLRRHDLVQYDTKKRVLVAKSYVIWYLRVLVVLFLVLSFAVFRMNVSTTTAKSYEKGSVSKYLQAFANKNFETCDSMVASDRDKLLTKDTVVLGTNRSGEEIYKNLLTAAANGIKDIRVVDQKNGINHIIIDFMPYKPLDTLSLDRDEINDLVAKYIDGEIVQKDFEKYLSSQYVKIFDNNVPVIDDSASVITLEYDLKEKNPDTVEGIYDFVYEIMQKENLISNLELFEREIEREFDSLLTKYEAVN